MAAVEAVWLEDAETDLSFAVVASITPAPQQYRITISKPDIALMKRPERIDTADESTRGNVKLKIKIRNSSSKNSPDSNEIAVYCVDPFTNGAESSLSYRFSQLKASGDNHLIGTNRDKDIEFTTVCRGVASPGSSPLLYVKLNPTGVLRQLASGTVAWPFTATTNTLWHRQTQMIGGLQIAGKSAGLCSSSFTLKLKPLGTGSETQTASTTAHCTSASASWRQGSVPLISSSQIIGATSVMPTPAPSLLASQGGLCNISDSDDECRIGDQAYATTSSGVTSANRYIYKPTSKNSGTRADLARTLTLALGHFTSSSARFRIVAARPPALGDLVQKVGRTTGWTSGLLAGRTSANDPSCPGNATNSRTDDTADAGYYLACIAYAYYLSDGRDSGSPVFVLPDSSSSDVILVGVHVRRSEDITMAGFIPIDRVYAESLAQGYDWNPLQLRPVPVLDRQQPAQGAEDLEVDDNDVITATFEAKDFAPQPHSSLIKRVLTYKAALFREGTKMDVPEVPLASFTDTTVQIGNQTIPVKKADFDIAAVTATQSTGTFTVAVRACTVATPSMCGGYGSAGSISLTRQ